MANYEAGGSIGTKSQARVALAIDHLDLAQDVNLVAVARLRIMG